MRWVLKMYNNFILIYVLVHYDAADGFSLKK